MITLIYFFMGFTMCDTVYGPSIKLSEKSNNYYKDLYGIYYCKDHKMFGEEHNHRSYNVHRLEDVDGSSFEVIADDYAKDKDHVFYRDKMLLGKDPKSFSVENIPTPTTDNN